jgi:glycosyltransferase involved in cell wall biosynthesis
MPLRPLPEAATTPVSAVLITLDEQHDLPDALASVAFCDEILVVDAGSSDRTRELAAAAGARVLVNTPWPGFVEQRRLATQAARHDWILALDADERVSPALRAEIEALRGVTTPAALDPAGVRAPAAYRMPRASFYLGRWIRATDWYPDLQVRLFDRRRAHWQGGLVHESVAVDGAVGRLRHELLHYPYADISDHLRCIDRYTDLWAREAHARGRRAGVLAALGAAGWAFLRNYLLRHGWRLGTAGLAVALLNTHYTFVKLLKLHELRQRARAQP